MFTSETLSSEAQLTLNGCGVCFCDILLLFWNLEGMDAKKRRNHLEISFQTYFGISFSQQNLKSKKI